MVETTPTVGEFPRLVAVIALVMGMALWGSGFTVAMLEPMDRGAIPGFVLGLTVLCLPFFLLFLLRGSIPPKALCITAAGLALLVTVVGVPWGVMALLLLDWAKNNARAPRWYPLVPFLGLTFLGCGVLLLPLAVGAARRLQASWGEVIGEGILVSFAYAALWAVVFLIGLR